MSVVNAYSSRSIEAAPFYHLLMSRSFARSAFADLLADDFGNPDLAEAWYKAEQAYRNGLDLTKDQRCIDYLTHWMAVADPCLLVDAATAVEAVRLQSLRRRIAKANRAMTHIIDDPTIDAAELSAAAQQYAAACDDRRITSAHASTAQDAIRAHLTSVAQVQAGNSSAVLTGLDPIDRRLELAPGNLVIIGGRPSMGKTALAISMMAQQIQRKIARPGFLSLEMSIEETTKRLLASMSGIPYGVLVNGQFEQYQLPRHTAALEELNTSGAMIYAPARSLSAVEIDRIAAEWVRKNGVNCLYVDQLSHIRHIRRERKNEAMADSVAACKRIAKEQRIPVVLLVQQNRGDRLSRNKPPSMDDLKDCGEIEQDADIVLMPWQPSRIDIARVEVDGREVDTAGKAWVYCRKYRNGECFREMMAFDGETMTFNRARA